MRLWLALVPMPSHVHNSNCCWLSVVVVAICCGCARPDRDEKHAIFLCFFSALRFLSVLLHNIIFCCRRLHSSLSPSCFWCPSRAAPIAAAAGSEGRRSGEDASSLLSNEVGCMGLGTCLVLVERMSDAMYTYRETVSLRTDHACTSACICCTP